MTKKSAGTKNGGGDRLSIRVDTASGTRVGPGKIALLEAVRDTGSISAAGRALRMSYRRAWQLIEELNLAAGHKLVTTAAGGAHGGGAALTAEGEALVAQYRQLEAATHAAALPHLMAIGRLMAR